MIPKARIYWSGMYKLWRCETACTIGFGLTVDECYRDWLANYFHGDMGPKFQ